MPFVNVPKRRERDSRQAGLRVDSLQSGRTGGSKMSKPVRRRPGKVRGAPRSRALSGARRDKTTAICLALPSAEHADQGDHCVYRVRGKVFAYYLDNHHGDGIVSVCVKSELGENVDRVRVDSDRYYLPAHIGPRGWFGL